MLRVVARRKAAIAGVAGALATEAVLRITAFAGIKTFDLVNELGKVVFPHHLIVGWVAGLVVHLGVGIVWAIFYAYFFWARFNLRPALQGLVFAIIPAVLAILIVDPQLRLMQIDQSTVAVNLTNLFDAMSVGEIVTAILGHAAYGLVLGALYTRPVGYPANRPYTPPRVIPLKKRRTRADKSGGGNGFMFTTGIEGSYPTVDNGSWRIDEMESAGHYRHWQEDFELARDIGCSHIRYGPPLHLVFQGPGRYDWSLSDELMADLENFGPEPIVDLCHFGVPTWLGNLQNGDIGQALTEYAGAFAERYPWVRFYTPVNEMYVCTRNSALNGLWNEQRHDESAFVNAVFNLAAASVGMTDAILTHRKDAIFVNSESSEFSQPCCPDPRVQKITDFENERRFLPLDLIYAHKLSDTMRDYLHEHRVTDESLDRFAHREVPKRSILGIDYYESNEHLIDMQGHVLSLGELFGWYTIAMQYYRRYKMPMMHTETNRSDAAQASRWLWRQWHNVQLAMHDGVPLVGFTWYSVVDQVDWQHNLDKPLGLVTPVGLFDLNRDARAVGLSYKHLIDMYCNQAGYRECDALVRLMK